MIHRTYRSLDQAPKLVGFTLRQWAALIAGASAVLGLIYLAHLPTKPAITLSVFLIGLPAALTYVSESGGLQLGHLLADMCRWRLRPQRLAAVEPGADVAPGVLVLGCPEDELAVDSPPASQPADNDLQRLDPIEALLSEERWER